jgi:ParB/RepB/Spo0J family partition protein
MKAVMINLDQIEFEPGLPPAMSLVKNIEKHGQLVPVLVQPNSEGKFRLRDGRRRVQALRKLGIEEAKAVVLDGEVSGPLLTVIAQFHRSSNPVVEARALQEIIASGIPQEDLPELLGVSEALIRQRLAVVTRLHSDLVKKIEDGTMPVSAARIAVNLDDDEQEELASRDQVYLKDVEALARADKMALLDLDAIDVPDSPAYSVLAAQLSVVACGLAGKDKQALLEAVRILEGLAQKGGV